MRIKKERLDEADQEYEEEHRTLLDPCSTHALACSLSTSPTDRAHASKHSSSCGTILSRRSSAHSKASELGAIQPELSVSNVWPSRSPTLDVTSPIVLAPCLRCDAHLGRIVFGEKMTFDPSTTLDTVHRPVTAHRAANRPRQLSAATEPPTATRQAHSVRGPPARRPNVR